MKENIGSENMSPEDEKVGVKPIAKGAVLGAAALSAAAMGADELADGRMQHTLDPVRENISVKYTNGIQEMEELRELKKNDLEAYTAKAKEEAIRREGGRKEFLALSESEQAQAIQNVFQDFNDFISGDYSNLGEGGNEVVVGGIKYEVRDDQLADKARREAIQQRVDENQSKKSMEQEDNS